MSKINAILMGICALSAVGVSADDSEGVFSFVSGDTEATYLSAEDQYIGDPSNAASVTKKNPDGSITTTTTAANGVMTAKTKAKGGKLLYIVKTIPIIKNGKVHGSKIITKAPNKAELGKVITTAVKAFGVSTATGFAPNGTQIYTSVITASKATRKTTTVTTYTTGTIETLVQSSNGDYTQTATDPVGNIYYTIVVSYSHKVGTKTFQVSGGAVNIVTTLLQTNGTLSWTLSGFTGSTTYNADGSTATLVPAGLTVLGAAGTVASYTFTPNADGTKTIVGFNANNQKTTMWIINPDGSSTAYYYNPNTGAITNSNNNTPGTGAGIQLLGAPL